jgi:hypothetical protein
MTTAVRAALIFAISLFLTNGAFAQINYNQIDTFESGTTLNWSIGSPTFVGPTVQPGGPTGNFLQLISNQMNGPPHWIIFNQLQWAGNYNAPNPPGSPPVQTIEMDLANFSATFAAMRIAIKPAGGMSSGYVFVGGTGTNGAFDAPGDSVWRHYSFPINASTMAPVNDPLGNPPPPLAQLLSSVFELRIVQSQTAAFFNMDFYTGRIGIDNIQATPEPSGILAAAAIAAGIAAPLRWRRRKKALAGAGQSAR